MSRIKGARVSFVVVPNVILTDIAISDGAFRLYALLVKYAWQDESTFVGQTRLAADLNISTRAVRNRLQELEDRGLISTEQRGLRRTNVTVLPSDDEVRDLYAYEIRKATSENRTERKETSGQYEKRKPASENGPDRKMSSGQDRKETSGPKELHTEVQPPRPPTPEDQPIGLDVRSAGSARGAGPGVDSSGDFVPVAPTPDPVTTETTETDDVDIDGPWVVAEEEVGVLVAGWLQDVVRQTGAGEGCRRLTWAATNALASGIPITSVERVMRATWSDLETHPIDADYVEQLIAAVKQLAS